MFSFDTPQKILALVFGSMGIVFNVLVFQQSTGKKLRLMKFASDICWFLQYLFVGAYTGAAIGCIAIVREIVFMLQEKHPWARHKAVLAVFICLGLLSPAVTWSGPVSLLPMVCSVSSVINLWLARPKLSRVMSFPVCGSMLVYDILTGSITGVVNESLSMIGAVIRMLVTDLKKKPEAAE